MSEPERPYCLSDVARMYGRDRGYLSKRRRRLGLGVKVWTGGGRYNWRFSAEEAARLDGQYRLRDSGELLAAGYATFSQLAAILGISSQVVAIKLKRRGLVGLRRGRAVYYSPEQIDILREHDATARGEEHYNAKLSAELVREIRRRYEEGGVSYPELSAEFAISRRQIGRIVRRESWAHV